MVEDPSPLANRASDGDGIHRADLAADTKGHVLFWHSAGYGVSFHFSLSLFTGQTMRTLYRNKIREHTEVLAASTFLTEPAVVPCSHYVRSSIIILQP